MKSTIQVLKTYQLLDYYILENGQVPDHCVR
jgi:hypothetical protein